MTEKAKKERIKIVTPEFRVSFPQVFTPKAVNVGDKEKYSIQMLFRVKKTPTMKEGEIVVDLKPVQDAVRAILFEKLGPTWQEEIKKRKADGSALYKTPFRSGTEAGKIGQEGFGDGVIFCAATSVMKPGLVDGRKQPILMPSEFYGGCYARATVNPYWYDTKGNKGVALGLQNIQKIRDGEPFSGRTKAEDDFDAIETPGGAEPVGAGAGAATTPPADMGGLL